MEPSDEELQLLMPQQLRDDLATVSRMAAHGAGPDVTPGLFEASLTAGALQFVRAVLAAEAEGPAVPEGREPASVVGEPSDEELLELWQGWNLGWDPQKGTVLMPHPAEYARAVLARYGHQPAPPTEGEVADLIAWLGDEADQYDCIQQAPETARRLRRAADLFAQRHPAPVPGGAANPWKDALIDALVCNFLLNKENESDPKKALHDLVSWETRLARDPSINPLMRPVPVSERLPGPEDCDGEGRCWWEFAGSDDYGPSWTLMKMHGIPSDMTRWLPAWVHALPLPAVEVKP